MTISTRRLVKRNPEAEAVQWDGSDEQAGQIIDWLQYRGVEAEAFPSGTFGPTIELSDQFISTVAYTGDWITFDGRRVGAYEPGELRDAFDPHPDDVVDDDQLALPGM